MLFEVVCQQKRFTCKWKMWFRHVFDPRLRVLVKEIVTVTLFSVYIVLCSFSIDVLWVSQGLRRKKESKGRRKREKEGGVEEGTWTICILNSYISELYICVYVYTYIYIYMMALIWQDCQVGEVVFHLPHPSFLPTPSPLLYPTCTCQKPKLSLKKWVKHSITSPQCEMYSECHLSVVFLPLDS